MPTSTIASIAGIVSLITGVLILAVCAMFLLRYAKRKAKSVLYLSLSTVSWLGATWSATVIYLLAGLNLDLAMAFQKFVYAFVFAGTTFTLYFAYEIFYEKARKLFLNAYTIASISIVAVMLALDSVDVGGFPDDTSYPLLTIAIEYSLIVVVFIIPVVLGILVIALRMRARSSDKVSRAGLGLIAGGQISILLTFVVDTIASLLVEDEALYPAFLYATWLFPLAGVVMYYLGWIMPEWLKTMISRTKAPAAPAVAGN
ncbi:MAG: hypothetical protein JW839_21310 [Candidatus Lokiarchaeota archaeon]|nr:hypothetical protein [Candidatus Lokiarchaeota archaeon]